MWLTPFLEFFVKFFSNFFSRYTKKMVRFFHFFFVLFFLSQSVRSETRRYAAYPPSSVVKANFGARFKFENTRRWLVEPGPRGALTLRHWVLLWLQSISFFSLVIIKKCLWRAENMSKFAKTGFLDVKRKNQSKRQTLPKIQSKIQALNF